ncbi:MAG TPA: guanylate kinase [Bacillota bacterium]
MSGDHPVRMPGLLVVLSAPSGAGKGAIRAAVQRRMPDLRYGVSVTTRRARPGEEHGVHYEFVDEATFERKVQQGEFLEWADVYGNRYGTPRQPMEDWLRQGIDVIVEKDVQGARALMDLLPDAVYVFILPPSLEELRRRMIQRGTESPEARRQRLRSAREELLAVDRYDYCIVNDDVERAADRLCAVIQAEKLRVRRFIGHGRRFWLDGLGDVDGGIH